MIGERLKHNYPGCTAWIITDKAEHFAKIGLRPSARYQLLNGALECELRGYELFAGKKSEQHGEGGEERRTPRIERRERRPRPEGGRPRRERRFDGESPRRAFDGERRERRFDGDKPRRAFDGERRERRFDRDKPRRAFDDGERRERRFDGDKPRRHEGQLWPNDRFRYRDEAGRERLRSKRPTRLQHFSAEAED